MRATKPLIFASVTVFGLGVGYDIAANAGLIKGDGHDHTVPRVPASVSIGAPLAATTTVIHAAAYVANMTTGDEYRVPPRDHREYASYATPAARYIYIIGAKSTLSSLKRLI